VTYPWGIVPGETYPDCGEVDYVVIGTSEDGAFSEDVVAAVFGETMEQVSDRARIILAADAMLATLELFQKFAALDTPDEAIAAWCRSVFAKYVQASIELARGEEVRS
jgi:hypothetical protein